MKRRDIFLLLSFFALFVLFAFFQNFSFPTKQLDQLSGKKFFKESLRGFVPTYAFKNFIGPNEEIETPYGYKEEVSRRLASVGEPIIFDEKKFLKEEIKNIPIYRNLKDLIDVAESEASEHCVNNPTESQNNCHAEYSGQNSKPNSSAKFKANPFRQTASVSLPGEGVNSTMMYDMDRNSVNVQITTDIGQDAGLKLEIDSQNQSGAVNIDVRW